MLYIDFFKKASEAVILQDENSGVFFLDPHYRVTLKDWNLDPDDIEDYPCTMNGIRETMKLEVERLNAAQDKSLVVMDWLYGIITAAVQPAILQEENEYIKNMMEYMKLNASLKEKEKDLAHRETQLEDKDNIRQMMPGMSFSKKKTK